MDRTTVLFLTLMLTTPLILLSFLAVMPDPSAYLPEDAAYLREAMNLGREVARETFPDWRPGSEPFLVTKGRVNYLVNYPDEDGLSMAGRLVEGYGDRVWRLHKPKLPVVAATSIPFDPEGKVWVTVVPAKTALDSLIGGLQEGVQAGRSGAGLIQGLLKGGDEPFPPDLYVTVQLHEAFHTYQSRVFPGWVAALEDSMGAEEDNDRLFNEVYRDIKNNQLQTLEGRELHAAIKSSDLSGARTHARRFLDLRDERRAYLTERFGDSRALRLMAVEEFYEWLEGLARYIEIKAWEVGARESYRPVEALGKDPEFRGYRGLEGKWGRDFRIEQIRTEWNDDEVRERIYALGAGQALLLDRLSPGWHEEAMKPVTLTELLRNALLETNPAPNTP